MDEVLQALKYSLEIMTDMPEPDASTLEAIALNKRAIKKLEAAKIYKGFTDAEPALSYSLYFGKKGTEYYLLHTGQILLEKYMCNVKPVTIVHMEE